MHMDTVGSGYELLKLITQRAGANPSCAAGWPVSKREFRELIYGVKFPIFTERCDADTDAFRATETGCELRHYRTQTTVFCIKMRDHLNPLTGAARSLWNNLEGCGVRDLGR